MSELVILLHGIGHTRWNMQSVDWALRRNGYDTLNITYPSRRHDLLSLVPILHERLQAGGIRNDDRVHFVTHSMGGLLARHYLDSFPRQNLGRMVMLGPPNGGSEIADLLQNVPPYRWLFGPAGQDLTTKRRAAVAMPLPLETGIIAGTAGWLYPLANCILPGRNDGRVSVDSTRLPDMKDHMIIHTTHSLMAWRPAVHRQTIHFLTHGAFHRV